MAAQPRNLYGICGKCDSVVVPVPNEPTELECVRCGCKYPAPPRLWWSLGADDEVDFAVDLSPRQELSDVRHW